MTDIVERLRKILEASKYSDGSYIPLGLELNDAIDEIAELRARCETLQADFDAQIAGHRLSAKQSTDNLLRATRAEAMCADLAGALEAITDRYVALVSSGDCGFWDAEEEAAVKESRSVLARREATP